MNSHQSSAGRDVQGSGELQEILPVLVMTAYEDRYSERQPQPLAPFCFWYAPIQSPSPFRLVGITYRTLAAKQIGQIDTEAGVSLRLDPLSH